MGLDFINKIKNRFVTAERKNFDKELGLPTLFSAVPHIFKKQFTCVLAPDSSGKATVKGRVILLRIHDGFSVISPANPNEVLGFLAENGTKELDAVFKKLPEAPQALKAKITEVGECTPTFVVEIDSPEDEATASETNEQ